MTSLALSTPEDFGQKGSKIKIQALIFFTGLGICARKMLKLVY